MTMDFSKDRLLASGFTVKELQKLQHNIDNFGGTFEEVIGDLAKRFKFFCGFFFAVLRVFGFLFIQRLMTSDMFLVVVYRYLLLY